MINARVRVGRFRVSGPRGRHWLSVRLPWWGAWSFFLGTAIENVRDRPELFDARVA